MRIVSLEHLPIGARLGESVYEANGVLLLGEGVALTQFHIDALRERGVATLYVQDEQTHDIRPHRPVSQPVRRRMTRTLRETFKNVGEQLRPLQDIAFNSEDPSAPDFRKAVRNAIGRDALTQVVKDVDLLLDDLTDGGVVSGLGSLRSHDTYTFEHSIDVTILGLLLGKKAGWDGWRLRLFGIGLLLHDLGKLFVEPEILNKPGALTDDEFDRVKRHPDLGYTLIRELIPSLGPLPAHVAYQHHERQDGTGYPRGLKGTNHLGESPAGYIHVFGSLSAVADVYDALASDRPYRAGYPVDHVVRLITGFAGGHLNRQAVELFKQVVAPFPVCSEVIVQNGTYAGCVAVVSGLNPNVFDRPKIRVVSELEGGEIKPVDLDLALEPHIQIASAAGSVPDERASRDSAVAPAGHVLPPNILQALALMKTQLASA